jgi:hypothetical protein
MRISSVKVKKTIFFFLRAEHRILTSYLSSCPGYGLDNKKQRCSPPLHQKKERAFSTSPLLLV